RIGNVVLEVVTALVMALIDWVHQSSATPGYEVAPEQLNISTRSLVDGPRPRIEDHGLVGRSGVLGQKHIGAHTLIAIRGVERHLLLSPEFGVLLDRVQDRIKRRWVVPVQ